jgi:hypothetical protein
VPGTADFTMAVVEAEIVDAPQPSWSPAAAESQAARM